ncbi:MAG: Rossmann-like and DUF2520 domain-containing protein [Rikenellaceae bacterium]
MREVTIIGSGGVAEALAKGIAANKELRLKQIYGRNEARTKELSRAVGCENYPTLLAADIYIVAVSDRAIEELTQKFSFPTHSIVVHTAGSVAMEAIAHPRRGVLYPLQSFTAGREVDTTTVPFFVEGSTPEITAEIEEIAQALSQNVMRMESEGRKKLHLCGVFASNFTNAIYASAAQIAQSAQIPFALLKPLILETCHKALSVEDPRTVQTGPAVRGDKETQNKHLEMLKKDENLEKIYKILSKQIWETSKKM